MNVPPSIPLAGGKPGGVHTRRCVRHEQREAAARCPSCGGYFCRECVVDHAGRLLCARCLAGAAAARKGPRQRWVAARRTMAVLAAMGVAWVSFYIVGALLLKVPPTFHSAAPARADEGDER